MKINDFGISKYYKEKNCKENGGTQGYIAPEVLFNQNHTYTADYFAVGVIGYELMLGYRPYNGKDKQDIKFDILSHQVKITKKEKPKNWSKESVDLINKLIERKKDKRLGANGIKEIKEHKWFKNFDWANLYFQKLQSPFIIDKEDNNLIFDNILKNKNDIYELQNIDKVMKILGSSQYEKSFKKFYYFNREEFHKKGKLRNTFINPHLSQYINKRITNDNNKSIEENNIKKDEL